MLATQSIEARAQQEGCRQAYTIGLSINEDIKLEKGKEKKGSAARSFMRSSGHISLRDCVYHNVYHNPLFSTSAVIPLMDNLEIGRIFEGEAKEGGDSITDLVMLVY